MVGWTPCIPLKILIFYFLFWWNIEIPNFIFNHVIVKKIFCSQNKFYLMISLALRIDWKTTFSMEIHKITWFKQVIKSIKKKLVQQFFVGMIKWFKQLSIHILYFYFMENCKVTYNYVQKLILCAIGTSQTMQDKIKRVIFSSKYDTESFRPKSI